MGSFTHTPSATQILIDPSTTYQTIIGFGGAFTGAATYNTYSLKDVNAQENLIKAYFGAEGNGYNLARVPIAASDFSLSIYSYDDTPDDFDLTNFALGEEDLNYKIPCIQRALNLTNIRLFSSPWSAPGWMKTNGLMTHGSELKGDLSDSGNKYYKAFANYHLKFFEEYYKYNISFWGATMQNEPGISTWYPSMIMQANEQRDFLRNIYGPLMRSNNITKNLQIMIWDFNTAGSREYVETILSDVGAAQYAAGVGMHWYSGSEGVILDDIHENYSNKFLLYTEASASFDPADLNTFTIPIGDWNNGQHYAKDIINDLNHWSTGWTDWNMVLNATGKPRFNDTANDRLIYDAPIIVSSDGTEFYKQPAYYVMGHISKFIVPNSTRISMDLNQNSNGLQGVAFLTPFQQVVMVFSNAGGNNMNISVQLARTNQYLNLEVEANSISTLVWKPFATQCPSGWYQGNAHANKCYQFISDVEKPWFEANYDCTKFDNTATLISIDDAFENSEITQDFPKNSTCSYAYIGLIQNGNAWNWSNHDSSTYRNWKSGYPTNETGKICAAFDPRQSGQWLNQDCDIPQCYICQLLIY